MEGTSDYWEEKGRYWIRHHRQPRRVLFHPAGAPDGPNCHELRGERITIMDGTELRDQWNTRERAYAKGAAKSGVDKLYLHEGE